MVLAHDLRESHKTKDIQISRDVTFDTMLFSTNTLEGLKKSGFLRPSPIQLHGIPLGKCGFDLLLEAKSGTGKTAVFTVIALEKLDLEKGLQAIILAPTREIAFQICDVFRQIGCQYNGLRVEVVMGGLPLHEDIDKFKGNQVHIVVGSPGRLKHLISEHHMDISAVRLIVFDEADKLMEKCFLSDIKFIHVALPQEKQVIMSSATYPETCKEFIKEFVHDAQHICPSSDCVLLGVVQKITHVKSNTNSVTQTRNRFRELLQIITTKQFKQCLIFCNYRARVREVYKLLTRAKWPTEQLYGAQDQLDRLDALKILQEYKCRILIATDLAARGIDASNVDLVVNFEPPFEWQTYLHRIGRAGRFGSYGMAITILSEGNETEQFMNLLSAANLTNNVSQLWTEAESNSSIAEKVVHEADNHLQLNDHSYSELWKMICDTENSPDKIIIEDFYELVHSFHNNSNGISTFSDLCDSFQNTNSENTDKCQYMDSFQNNSNGIASFSDLCNSYQNNHFADTKECEYKCVKWPDLSTKQCLIGITHKLKDTLEKTNSSHKSSYCVNGVEVISNTNTNLIMSVASEENNSKDNSSNSSLSCEENKDNSSDSISSCDKNSIDSKENDSKHSSNSTLSSEENNPKDNSRDSIPSLDKNSLSNPKNYVNNTDNKFSKMGPFKIHANKKLTSSSSEDFRFVGNESIHKCKQPKVRKTQSNRSSDQNCNTHMSNKSSIFNTRSKNHPTNGNLNKNSYKNWYKELQIRVKQIQSAIYLDELGKL